LLEQYRKAAMSFGSLKSTNGIIPQISGEKFRLQLINGL
jgi:hypothetical protein